MLILARPTDTHADAVVECLAAQARVHRHDLPDLVGLPVSWHLRTGQHGSRSGGRIGDIDLSAVTCVWHRRPSDFSGDDAAELRSGIGGILATLPHLNHPAAMARAVLKPLQLVAAYDAGLDVPGTTITTSPTDLESASHLAQLVVVKPLSGPDGRLASEDDHAGRGRTIHLTQRLIAADHHVRITYVDGSLFGTRIDSPHVDWRNDPHACRYTAVSRVARYFNDPIRALMKMLDLRFGALDFVADAHGGWWFLGVNPNAEWLWIEQATGQPISITVAAALVTPPD